VSYLTLPAGEKSTPKSPLPMVLLVHGGPWARDQYGYNSHHQWLANRGYAVLSVNFRGSVGFGKAFVNAGDLQWGRRMHDDLLDAVEWAVKQGVADRRRIAIMGGSYGGYATLAGLAFTPDVFCCGVDIVGPSNLETLLATVPPYWAAFFENLARRVGDPRTEDGRALLRERSPLHSADRITKPLLIGQGANDPRVKQAEADQIIEAMRAKNLPVTYVLYPQEGHGFAVPENSLSFNAIAETFLAAHLGGRCESFGEDFRGAEFDVRVGSAQVPGLEEALVGRG
jgi:dipeptidyl aminopeptidase/acylaminoacyl peptidase